MEENTSVDTFSTMDNNSDSTKPKMLRLKKKKKLNISSTLKAPRLGRNNSASSNLNSTLLKVTLKSNNRALAKALELVRQQLADSQRQVLQEMEEKQTLQAKYIELLKVSGLKNDEIEGEVNARLQSRLGQIKQILNKTSSSMLVTVDLIHSALTFCEPRLSREPSFGQMMARCRTSTEERVSPPSVIPSRSIYYNGPSSSSTTAGGSTSSNVAAPTATAVEEDPAVSNLLTSAADELSMIVEQSGIGDGLLFTDDETSEKSAKRSLGSKKKSSTGISVAPSKRNSRRSVKLSGGVSGLAQSAADSTTSLDLIETENKKQEVSEKTETSSSNKAQIPDERPIVSKFAPHIKGTTPLNSPVKVTPPVNQEEQEFFSRFVPLEDDTDKTVQVSKSNNKTTPTNSKKSGIPKKMGKLQQKQLVKDFPGENKKNPKITIAQQSDSDCGSKTEATSCKSAATEKEQERKKVKGKQQAPKIIKDKAKTQSSGSEEESLPIVKNKPQANAKPTDEPTNDRRKTFVKSSKTTVNIKPASNNATIAEKKTESDALNETYDLFDVGDSILHHSDVEEPAVVPTEQPAFQVMSNDSVFKIPAPVLPVSKPVPTVSNKSLLSTTVQEKDTTTYEPEDMELTGVFDVNQFNSSAKSINNSSQKIAIPSFITRESSSEPSFLKNVSNEEINILSETVEAEAISAVDSDLPASQCVVGETDSEKSENEDEEANLQDRKMPNKRNEKVPSKFKSVAKVKEVCNDILIDENSQGEDNDESVINGPSKSETRQRTISGSTSSDGENVKKNFSSYITKSSKIQLKVGRKDSDEIITESKKKATTVVSKIKQIKPTNVKKRLKPMKGKLLPKMSPLDAVAKPKEVFDLSLNESIPVPSSLSYRQFVDTKKIHNKNVVDNVNASDDEPSPGSALNMTESEHGIMIVLGNGKRTKPRRPKESKGVTYCENLEEDHLITPAPVVNKVKSRLSQEKDTEKFKVSAGHTPPKKPLNKTGKKKLQEMISHHNQASDADIDEDDDMVPSSQLPDKSPEQPEVENIKKRTSTHRRSSVRKRKLITIDPFLSDSEGTDKVEDCRSPVHKKARERENIEENTENNVPKNKRMSSVHSEKNKIRRVSILVEKLNLVLPQSNNESIEMEEDKLASNERTEKSQSTETDHPQEINTDIAQSAQTDSLQVSQKNRRSRRISPSPLNFNEESSEKYCENSKVSVSKSPSRIRSEKANEERSVSPPVRKQNKKVSNSPLRKNNEKTNEEGENSPSPVRNQKKNVSEKDPSPEKAKTNKKSTGKAQKKKRTFNFDLDEEDQDSSEVFQSEKTKKSKRKSKAPRKSKNKDEDDQQDESDREEEPKKDSKKSKKSLEKKKQKESKSHAEVKDKKKKKSEKQSTLEVYIKDEPVSFVEDPEPVESEVKSENHIETEQSEETSGRRARRAGAGVSYKEPSLNSKLRRGDPIAKTVYDGRDAPVIYKGNKDNKKF